MSASVLSMLSGVFDPLAKASLQAGAIILVVLAIRAALGRRLSGGWLHAFWLIVLVRLALPWTPQVHWSPFALVPSVESPLPRHAPAAAPSSGLSHAWVSDAGGPGLEPGEAIASASRRAEVESINPWHVLYALWLAGMAGLAAYVVIGTWRFWRSITRERLLTDQHVLELLEDCKQAMGIHTPIGIVVTDRATSPALFGFLRPRILLPAGVLETLDRNELRHVLLHELAHLRRHDVLLGWVACVLQIVHWCNPLVWLAASRMRADRELACDAMAMRALRDDEPRAYGNTILRLLERFSRPRYLPALTGILEDRNQLRRRISMIARFNPRAKRTSIAGAVIFLALTGVALTDAPEQTGKDEKTPPATAPSSAATERFSPDKVYVITPGKGLEIISVCDSAAKAEKVFGTPSQKEEFNNSYKLAYESAGVDFIVGKRNDQINEIHFNEAFRGKLAKGLRMGSTLEQVLAQTGGVKKTVNASPEEAQSLHMGGDRVLYNQKMGRKVTAYELTDVKRGANYWFDEDKKLVQVVVFSADEAGETLTKDQLPEGSRINERGNIVDRTDWPFVDDPAVIGKWESVDFVKSPAAFTPGKPAYKQYFPKLFLKGMVFEKDGKANYGFLKWTKGKVIHMGDKTASEYVIKSIGGDTYLFTEWKSGDYTVGHQKPWWYVLKKLPADSPKLASARELLDLDQEWPEVKLGPDSHIDEKGNIVDKVDYPFVDDPAVIGTWKSVDFVKNKAEFKPGKRNWKGDLYLKEIVFKPEGKIGPVGNATWTKGLVLHHKDKKASAYEIVEKDGAKYMFYEWKSGDYIVLHRQPAYYVLKKVDKSEQE